MFKFLTDRWQSKKPNKSSNPRSYSPAKEYHPLSIEVPEGWFVFEMGQSMAHMLWYCQMINFDDLMNKVEKPRRVWVEELDTPNQAMQLCVDAIHKGDFI